MLQSRWCILQSSEVFVLTLHLPIGCGDVSPMNVCYNQSGMKLLFKNEWGKSSTHRCLTLRSLPSAICMLRVLLFLSLQGTRHEFITESCLFVSVRLNGISKYLFIMRILTLPYNFVWLHRYFWNRDQIYLLTYWHITDVFVIDHYYDHIWFYASTCFNCPENYI